MTLPPYPDASDIYELEVQPQLRTVVYRLKVRPGKNQLSRLRRLLAGMRGMGIVSYHAQDNEVRFIDPPPLTPPQLQGIGRQIINAVVPAYQRGYKA